MPPTQRHMAELIAALSDPRAYPFPVREVEVRQTHISAAFLTVEYVYKIKKAVALGFVDFSTLDRRRHFCEEEVRLNRRLAPDVYLGVVPVTESAGRPEFEGAGEPVEWAVKMRRLPDSATLLARLSQGKVDDRLMAALARRIAGFHAQAESGPRIASFGRFEIVAGNAIDNLTQSVSQIGTMISQSVHRRLRALTDDALTRLRALIDRRAERGVPRDTHGDLHLDHVYLFEDRPPPNDLIAIDCIEFNERFRFADPVSDVAFLAMDLIFRGRRDLAAPLLAAYFSAAQDPDGRSLSPLYISYRAAVRGKVEGLAAAESEVPANQRDQYLVASKAHWLLALGELETPIGRPCLVLVTGLPGTGKSTLAHGLARAAGLAVIRSDAVRKELAGMPPHSSQPAEYGAGIYTPQWTERTYAECLARAEALVFEGERVAIDASFGEESHRRQFLAAAACWAVPAVLFTCRAEPEVVRERLKNRSDDPSDADWNIYLKSAERWEPFAPATERFAADVPCGESADKALDAALSILRDRGLANGD